MNSQNANRLRVKELVSSSPGIHLRRLQKLLGVSWSTTRYHVYNLMKDGEIVSSPSRGHNRLYPAGTTHEMKTVYACLQNKSVRKVLRGLANGATSGLTQAKLSEMVRLSRSTISSCVATLDGVGFVRRRSTTDGQVTLEVQDRKQVLELLAVFDRNDLLSVATDRFSDLWDI